jgi:hypothetical protein
MWDAVERVTSFATQVSVWVGCIVMKAGHAPSVRKLQVGPKPCCGARVKDAVTCLILGAMLQASN